MKISNLFLLLLFIGCEFSNNDVPRTVMYIVDDENADTTTYIDTEAWDYKLSEFKAKDYSKLNCDSLYGLFTSWDNTRILGRYDDREPKNYLFEYYYCLNSKNPGEYQKYIDKLKEYAFVSDEKGVILATTEEGDEMFPNQHFFLLDDELNKIVDSDQMSHFYHDFTFFRVDSMERETIYDSSYNERGQVNIHRDFHYRLINKKGEFINNERYYDYTFWENGLIEISDELYWGLMDTKKNIVIPRIYHELWQREEGLLLARKRDKWAVMNVKNEKLTAFKYTYEEAQEQYEEHLRILLSKK